MGPALDQETTDFIRVNREFLSNEIDKGELVSDNILNSIWIKRESDSN
jgi:hypothetical protein